MNIRRKFAPFAKLGLASIILLHGACGQDSESRLKATIDPLATDFQIGRGINILSGQALGDCLQPLNPAPAFDVDGKESSFTINKIESSNDLIKQMGMTAKAKYFGENGPVSGKTSFTDQFSVNQQSLFLSFTVRVTNPLYTASNASLRPEAIELFKSQGAEAFREACGDEFVRSYTSGGELIAVLEIHTKSETHKETIEESIKGSYGSYPGPSSFSKNLEQVISENQTDFYIYQSGGVFEHTNLSAEALINKAMAYPSSVTKFNSRPILAYTAPYKTLLNFPAGPTPYDLAASDRILAQMASDDLHLIDLLKNIDYILTHESQYPAMTSSYRQTLIETKNRVNSTLGIIRNQANACLASIRNCQMPSYQLPSVQLIERVELETIPVPNPPTPPGPAAGEANSCILWLAKDGVPHHRSKTSQGEKRSKRVLAIGKSYKYSDNTVGKEYTCRKVKDGIQTLDLRLTTFLGYWEDSVVKDAIDYV